MVVIEECSNVYPNNSYHSSSFSTDYIFIGNSTFLEFVVYTNSNSSSLSLEWSSDGENTLLIDTLAIISTEAAVFQSVIKASYVKMNVINLDVPCTLFTQGMFFN